MPETDGELVERAKVGSLDAFEILLRRHEAVATRVAVVIAGLLLVAFFAELLLGRRKDRKPVPAPTQA